MSTIDTTAINLKPAVSPPSWVTRASKQYLTFDSTVDKYFSNKEKSIKSPVLKKILKPIKSLAVMLTSYDFNHFINSKTPRARIAEPPLGALMLMMYIGLLGARAARGWQRGKPPGSAQGQKRDYREMLDVLRRDMWGITFYIFGFGVVNRLLVNRAQKRKKLILQNKEGKTYTFTQHDLNARLSSAQVLQAHYDKGNKQALLKAANNNSYMGVPQFIARRYPELRKQLADSVNVFRSALRNADFALATEQLEKLDTMRDSVVKQMSKNSTLTAKKLGRLTKQWPEYKDFLARYLQHKRIPMDVTSFGLLFVLIGYGPIWLNRVLTEHQYRKNNGMV